MSLRSLRRSVWGVFALPELWAKTAVILSALPTGTGPFMLAAFYKREAEVKDLAKLTQEFSSADNVRASARKLFTLHLLNIAMRNADAHLKNFAVTCTSAEDVRLAPVYDVVTVTVYPRYKTNLPALPLYGKRVWASGKALVRYGGAWLGLNATDMTDSVERVTAAVHGALPVVRECADRFPGFQEIAERMLDAWAQGLEDIRPDAKSAKSVPALLREQAGFSDRNGFERRKEPNPYANPDGAFSHKAR
jgi:serine/threonine-protein kinase HipA